MPVHSDRPDNPEPTIVRWVEGALGPDARVVSSTRLIGGTMADMYRLVVDGGNEPREVVLRCWPDTWNDRISYVQREVAGLELLAESALPVPRLLAYDLGSEAGQASTLTTVVRGVPDLAPVDPADWVRQFAHALVPIHALPSNLEPVEGYPDPATVELDWLGDARLADEVRALATRPLDQTQSGLSHGDYQHFNVLWENGRLSGIVDWTGAGTGVRGRDVGHCRLNLAVLYSAEVADAFLKHYESEAGVTIDPAADLRELLSFSPWWPEFIPIQVAGRAPVDPMGMAGRVRELIRATLSRAG